MCPDQDWVQHEACTLDACYGWIRPDVTEVTLDASRLN